MRFNSAFKGLMFYLDVNIHVV